MESFYEVYKFVQGSAEAAMIKSEVLSRLRDTKRRYFNSSEVDRLVWSHLVKLAEVAEELHSVTGSEVGWTAAREYVFSLSEDADFRGLCHQVLHGAARVGALDRIIQFHG